MFRGFSIVIVTLLMIACSGDARAAKRGKRHVSRNGEFSFQLESHGRVLPIYTHRGRSYVEGTYRNHYAIRVFNHTGERIEAVVTVDGRDVISGGVGNYRKGRGYVISPYDSVLIDGFRTNWNNVAAFRFTDIGDAYAARMGDASNVGVIGVAIFKEKRYRPRPMPVVPYRDHGRESKRKSAPGLGTGYGAEAPAAPAPKSSTRGRGGRIMEESDIARDGYSQGLGTEYGRQTHSPATRTTFTRRSRRPSAVLAIRYDDREGLYAKGVLPRPIWPRPYYERPEKPNPFPSSPEPVTFAPPPPPRYDYWD
jgi:hypothetical protein